MITRRNILLDSLSDGSKYQSVRTKINAYATSFLRKSSKYKEFFFDENQRVAVVYDSYAGKTTISYDFKSDLEDVIGLYLNNEEVLVEVIKYLILDVMNFPNLTRIEFAHTNSVKLLYNISS